MFGAVKQQMKRREALYAPLSEAAASQENIDARWLAKRSGVSKRLLFLAAASFVLNIMMVFVIVGAWMKSGPSNPLFPQALYSPAQHFLQYEVVKFHSGFNKDITEYMAPPSPELDQKWEALYNHGISRISKSEARRLPNKTAPIPGDESHYLVSLDVFHQLHCLNQIRKALHPDYYKPENIAEDGQDELLGHDHTGHCIDQIRQSLMCSSDISPLVFQWKEEAQEVKEYAEVTHTCRNFDRIREWALERQMLDEFDTTIHIEDDIVIPEF